MYVSVDHRDNVAIVALDGNLDAVTTPRVAECLNEQLAGGHTRLALDFGRVAYVSSAGLRTILASLKAARQAQGDLRLAAVQPGVKKVFDMSGFTSILQFYDDADAAVNSFGP